VNQRRHPDSKCGRQHEGELHVRIATASARVRFNAGAGRPSSNCGRQDTDEFQEASATASAPARSLLNSSKRVPGRTLSEARR
jgi:hypothetical protein